MASEIYLFIYCGTDLLIQKSLKPLTQPLIFVAQLIKLFDQTDGQRNARPVDFQISVQAAGSLCHADHLGIEDPGFGARAFGFDYALIDDFNNRLGRVLGGKTYLFEA